MKKFLLLPVLFSALFLGGCSYYSQDQVTKLIQQESASSQAEINALKQQANDLQNKVNDLTQKAGTTAVQPAAPTTASNQAPAPAASRAATTTAATASVASKSYVSEKYGFQFEYPKAGQVTEGQYNTYYLIKVALPFTTKDHGGWNGKSFSAFVYDNRDCSDVMMVGYKKTSKIINGETYTYINVPAGDTVGMQSDQKEAYYYLEHGGNCYMFAEMLVSEPPSIGPIDYQHPVDKIYATLFKAELSDLDKTMQTVKFTK